MRKVIIPLFFAFVLLGTHSLNAQSFIDNASVNGSFQTDAQYYMSDNGIDITEATINGKRLGVNGFGKVGYTYGNFTAGLRFEASCLS